MVRAECYVAPLSSFSRKSAAEQKQSRVRSGRALAAARYAPPVPVTHQIVQEIKSLYPADPGPAVAAEPCVKPLPVSSC